MPLDNSTFTDFGTAVTDVFASEADQAKAHAAQQRGAPWHSRNVPSRRPEASLF
jgi:hypothetical protein